MLVTILIMLLWHPTALRTYDSTHRLRQGFPEDQQFLTLSISPLHNTNVVQEKDKLLYLAQSAGVVEYTDCILAEG